MKYGYVYILCNRRNGTLYIGVTSNLTRRLDEHRNKTIAGFTKKYNVTQLVYYETYENILNAIHREKELKRLGRKEKIALIEKGNCGWRDLYSDLG